MLETDKWPQCYECEQYMGLLVQLNFDEMPLEYKKKTFSTE